VTPHKHLMTEDEITQRLNRVLSATSDDVPSIAPPPAPTVTGVIKVRREPANGDELLTLAHDAAQAVLQRTSRTLALDADDPKLRALIAKIHRHMQGVVAMIDAYDETAQP
jgi:hypothetical protein